MSTSIHLKIIITLISSFTLSTIASIVELDNSTTSFLALCKNTNEDNFCTELEFKKRISTINRGCFSLKNLG